MRRSIRKERKEVSAKQSRVFRSCVSPIEGLRTQRTWRQDWRRRQTGRSQTASWLLTPAPTLGATFARQLPKRQAQRVSWHLRTMWLGWHETLSGRPQRSAGILMVSATLANTALEPSAPVRSRAPRLSAKRSVDETILWWPRNERIRANARQMRMFQRRPRCRGNQDMSILTPRCYRARRLRGVHR